MTKVANKTKLKIIKNLGHDLKFKDFDRLEVDILLSILLLLSFCEFKFRLKTSDIIKKFLRS